MVVKRGAILKRKRGTFAILERRGTRAREFQLFLRAMQRYLFAMKTKLFPLVFAVVFALAAIVPTVRAGDKPEIKFTAVDGREVDLAKLKGKVVLIDFWATWCGPCVAEIPHVLEAYKKFHAKGFEVIGISLDRDKNALTSFVKERGMPWPQSFESSNALANKYGINAIPAMWLVDKEGNLATKNARDNLAGQIEKLLAK